MTAEGCYVLNDVDGLEYRDDMLTMMPNFELERGPRAVKLFFASRSCSGVVRLFLLTIGVLFVSLAGHPNRQQGYYDLAFLCFSSHPFVAVVAFLVVINALLVCYHGVLCLPWCDFYCHKGCHRPLSIPILWGAISTIQLI